MAVYEVGVNDTQARKVWSKGLDAVALPKTLFSQVAGVGTNNVVELREDLKNQAGDRVRLSLRDLASEDVVTGNTTLEGNEEGLTIYDEDLLLDQVRAAHRVNWHNADHQRVPYDLREECRLSLGDKWRRYYDQCFFNHLCGYTPEESATNPKNGNNTIESYNTDNQVYPDSETTDQGLDTTNDEFTLQLVDKAVEKAKTRDIPLRTVNWMGREGFICFIHPYQTTQLRADGTQWRDIQIAAMQGGRVDDNPLTTGYLGYYNGVFLVESPYVTQGVDSTSSTTAVTTVRRAVLCGAQAIVAAFGRWGDTNTKHNWIEKTFDYENQLGIASRAIWGLKRPIYNSTDYGSITISSYSVAS